MKSYSEDVLGGKELFAEVISLLLVVGILYFGIKGALVLSLQTTSPMMGVSGDSMTQPDNSWNEYYVNNGLDTSAFPFNNGLQNGDLVILTGVDSLDEIQIGDVVVWREGGASIIHRVAVINPEQGYVRTRSDKYGGLDRRVRVEDILGKAVYSVPYLGYLAI